MTQAAILAASGSPGTTTGFKNKLINGNMTISQRKGSSADSITDIVQYTLDRWCAVSNPQSKLTVQQNAGSVTPPTGFTNYLGITVTTAYTLAPTGDFFNMVQFIEGYNAADLGWGTSSAKSITMSFWVRGSITGTYSFALRNEASNRSYVSTYTISSANTWEYKTISIPGCPDGTWLTDNGRGVEINFDLGRSAAYETSTANTWITTGSVRLAGTVKLIENASATLYITGCQFEVGTTATNFDFRSYGTELFLCQRYFYKISCVTGGDTNTPFSSMGWSYSTTNMYAPYVFPVPMRSTPSLSRTGCKLYNPSLGLSSSLTDSGIVAPSNMSANVYAIVASGLTSNYGYWITPSTVATDFVAFSAEL